MPCVFSATLRVSHIRLLIDTAAAIGHEYIKHKKAYLLMPVLGRLKPAEQQGLILAVATALILGGHLRHTVRAVLASMAPAQKRYTCMCVCVDVNRC